MARLLNLAVLGFAVASMFGVGLTYSVGRILGPLRDLRLVLVGLAANFVVVPLFGLAVANLFGLDEPYRIGLLLVATAAGAPFLIKLVQLADGDVAFAASLLVLLLPATIVYMPIVVPFIAPDADVDAGAIAMPLVLANLAPLAVGMAVFTLWPRVAGALRPIVSPLSTVLLIAVVILTIVGNWSEFAGIVGERAILAAIVFIVGTFVIGFVLGAPAHHKDETGLTTAQRNVAAATVVATQAIGVSETVVTVVVISIVAMVLLFPTAFVMRRYFGETVRGQPRLDNPGGTP